MEVMQYHHVASTVTLGYASVIPRALRQEQATGLSMGAWATLSDV